MRICIDATSLLLRSAGVKNYVYHWMRSLERHAKEDHIVTAFPFLGQPAALDHERSVLSPLATLPRIAFLHMANYGPRSLMDVLTQAPDVFHASNQVHQLPRGSRITGTIYDMTVELFPQFHTPGNVAAERRFYERVLKPADGLIAISQSSKNDAVRLLRLDPSRITVIYPGIDERFFSVLPADIERVKGAFKLSKPYVLFVGTVEPRKNVDVLLDAWSALQREVREEFELLIAGPTGWAQGETIARLRAGLPGVRVLGYIQERDLPALTAGATAFVYPSLYEGFGFPIAQAMAAGVPVITSAVSSMPEIAGNAGIYVDPKSTSQLCSAIDLILSSPTLRTNCIARGRDIAKQYTWRNAGVRSLAFFDRL